MHVILTVVGGKADRRQVRVKIPVMIGRSREAGLVVAHPMVSRRHCELYYDRGLVRVRDLGSLNGVYVGGRRVTDAPLPPQSEFSIGPLTLRVDYSPELLAQQFARQQPAAEAKPTPPPPPPELAAGEVGEFELEPEFAVPEAPADQAGFFPAMAQDTPREEDIEAAAEDLEPEPKEQEILSPPEGEKSPRNDFATLFPEDLPPELRE